MNAALTENQAVIAIVLAHLAAGTALGLVAGRFGRSILGLAAAVLLVSVMTGVAGTYVSHIADGVSTLPREDVISFLQTASGMAGLSGFLGGLYFTSRRRNR